MGVLRSRGLPRSRADDPDSGSGFVGQSAAHGWLSNRVTFTVELRRRRLVGQVRIVLYGAVDGVDAHADSVSGLSRVGSR